MYYCFRGSWHSMVSVRFDGRVWSRLLIVVQSQERMSTFLSLFLSFFYHPSNNYDDKLELPDNARGSLTLPLPDLRLRGHQHQTPAASIEVDAHSLGC